MSDHVAVYLQIGISDDFREVVMNLDKERDGVGHIVFSPQQARALAKLLIEKATQIENHNHGIPHA